MYIVSLLYFIDVYCLIWLFLKWLSVGGYVIENGIDFNIEVGGNCVGN